MALDRSAILNRWVFFSALLALSAFSGTAPAHLPEYFGRKYVLVPISPKAVPRNLCGGDERPALREQVAVLEGQLEEREAAEGVYSPALADAQGELAGIYATMCNHPAAMKQYRKAIQRLRVSEGLLTRAQLPYLRALADSYEAIGDFVSAQRAARHALRVHHMGTGELDAVALRDSLAYFQRARDTFLNPRSAESIELFFEAHQDNRAMLEAQIARDSVDYSSLEAVALSHLRNLYILLGTDISLASSQEGGTAAWTFMRRSQDFTYAKGVALLESLLERAAGEGDAVRAALNLRLGNWHQWNTKWQRACRHYARAWYLAGGEEGAALREQMSLPAELPEDPELWASLQGPEIPAIGTVAASYRVSSKGDVHRVEAALLGDDTPGVAGRLSRLLRGSHVRPAVVDGECVDGELTGRRYRFLR